MNSITPPPSPTLEEFGGPLPEKSWVAIAANPFSGARSNARWVERLSEALSKRGLEPRVLWDRRERAATLANPDLPRACCCVVAAGGDGTIADVVNEGLAVPLAILPLGTENLLARQLGFKREIDELTDAIVRGKQRRLDLGTVRSASSAGSQLKARHFTLMAGIGFDADVVHRLAAWRTGHDGMRRVRRWVYARPLVTTLCRYSYAPLELEADGQRYQGTHALAFNLPAYGLGLRFCREARGDDGMLDWFLFQRGGMRAAIGYLLAVACQRHYRRDDVIQGRSASLRIRCQVAIPAQADGDASGYAPLDIATASQALTLICH